MGLEHDQESEDPSLRLAVSTSTLKESRGKRPPCFLSVEFAASELS